MSTPINISASRGAAILGLSGYQSQIDIWLEMQEKINPGFCEKHGYKLPEREYNSAMKWGHAFESSIITIAEQKQNDEIEHREKFFSAYQKDFITCHIDGSYKKSSKPGYTRLHEGKTTTQYYFRDNFGDPGTDKVPMEYQIQCQHQLICTGAKEVILSVLVFPKRVEEWEEMGLTPNIDSYGIYYLGEFGTDMILCKDMAIMLNKLGYFHQYIITPLPELQNLMIDKYTEFWNENIIGGKMPEPISLDDIKKIYRDPVGTIVCTEEIEYLLSELNGIKSEISGTGTLAKRADMIKTQILNYARNETGVKDEDSQSKLILRSRDGKKLGQYFKNKNGGLVFR